MKYSLENDDWCFIVISCIIAIALYVIGLYNIAKFDLSLKLTVIGTLITFIALAFSIFQQMKLRNTSIQIESNTTTLKKSFESDIHNWASTKAIELTAQIETYLRDNDINPALCLIRYLQEMVKECTRVYNHDLYLEVKRLCECGVYEKNIKETLKDCLEKCDAEKIEKLTKISSTLSKNYINLTSKEQHVDIDVKGIISCLVKLREFLNSNKSISQSNY